MLANTTEAQAQPARIGAFYLGIQAVWGALLAISLQSRAVELSGAHAIVAASGILAIGAGVAAVVQIVAGTISDRRRARGSRRIEFYLVGTAVGAVGIAWFYLAPTLAQLTVGFSIVQLGLNVAIGAYQAIIPDTIEPRRTGLASSWMAGLQSAGNSLGVVLAAFVAQTRIVAAALIGLLIATCAITVSYVRGRTLQGIELAPRATPVANFANLFGSRLLLYAGFYTLLDYLYFFVRTLTADSTPARTKLLGGSVLLLFTVCGALGAALAARASDRADKRIVATFGGIGFAAALLVLPATRSLEVLSAVAVVAGAAWGVVLVADWALACRILPPRAMATSMAVWNLAVLLAQIAAPLVVNIAIGRAGATSGLHAMQIIFTIAAIEACLGIAWIWRLPKAFGRE
ncbi:MAG TPA: MFS transporter [Verrucomicrobiae bacterium]|jgi:MFS family permease|nr:MFS transporter [Verrucomicrobiae bacterium]